MKRKKNFIHDVAENNYSTHNPTLKQWRLWLVEVTVAIEMCQD